MNVESNLFNPTQITMSRSTFEYHPTVSGTCLAGRLIPIKSIEVLPGDSIKMDCRTLVKMSTPVYPTMDQLFMDVAFFFVPNKLILSSRYGTPDLNESNRSWASFIGAQDNLTNMPVPADGITLPRLYIGDELNPGSLLDYFGYPQHYNYTVLNKKINALDALAYFAIWNENYRDPNTMEPLVWNYTLDSGTGLYYVVPQNTPLIYLWGTEQAFDDGGSFVSAGNWAGAIGNYFDSSAQDADSWLPFPVCRFHGYFGSALPWPQRNLTGVELPLGDKAPVITDSDEVSNPSTNPLVWITGSGNKPSSNLGLVALANSGKTYGVSSSGSASGTLSPANLWADLSEATAANVNALRAAIQKQRWYEHLARSGNRLDELEFGLFGIRPHDSGDDRPQYLGGKRIPLNIEMVASTQGGTNPGSAQGAGSLGALGAFSHTNDSDHYFYHSFDTWGTLMCVMCIRHHDTYSQNLQRKWTRSTRDDFYWPTFAHLGEQAILNQELLLEGNANDTKVFGYQEAWSEYRHDPDRVCGLLRPGESLGFMTYAEAFVGVPTLAEFVNASVQAATIDRTLAISAVTTGFQFIYQFTFDYTARRCMPTYSDPGLIDHF